MIMKKMYKKHGRIHKLAFLYEAIGKRRGWKDELLDKSLWNTLYKREI